MSEAVLLIERFVPPGVNKGLYCRKDKQTRTSSTNRAWLSIVMRLLAGVCYAQ